MLRVAVSSLNLIAHVQANIMDDLAMEGILADELPAGLLKHLLT